MQPSDVEITPPPKEMNREAQHQDPEGLQIQTDIGTEEVTPTRLKSIIVSPKEGNEVEQEIIGNSMEVADDEETLRSFQTKTKNRGSKATKKRSPRLSPNILRGASFKKRKLSQIHTSPSNGRKRGNGEVSKRQVISSSENREQLKATVASRPVRNPAIQLITASLKDKQGKQGEARKKVLPEQIRETAGPSRREPKTSTKKTTAVPNKKHDFRLGPLRAP